MRPPQGMDFDFTQPRGEPALVPPNSISWRIFKNPVSLFVGGVAAVILELAEPSVRSGVWEHSSFRRDAVTRLRRTGFAAMMTVYGPRSAAERMIERVMRMHDRVRGTTPEGRPYHANDQRLLDWVQGTAPYGFIEAYHRFVRPLAADERSRAFAEGAVAARLYGALGAPASLQEWQRMLAETEPALQPSDTIFEFLDIMGSAPIAPRPFRPIQRLLIRAAVDLTPPELRRKLGLEEYGLSAMQRKLVETMGQASEKLPLLTAPPAQASVRMGLEPDYLYR
ncbi:oxygenase MpaB family protein [Chelativorans sp.]|uniref:oxygenase MpaB family protein n=1 Tax=Chelativorans sp. TaxID=2203393 RepID=UPI002811C6F6|nr:oxygenase MpaB family protein [Chelativorans sp.]